MEEIIFEENLRLLEQKEQLEGEFSKVIVDYITTIKMSVNKIATLLN